jgi:hypothetical protein
MHSAPKSTDVRYCLKATELLRRSERRDVEQKVTDKLAR